MQVAANDFIQSSRPTTPDTDYQDPPSSLPEPGEHLLAVPLCLARAICKLWLLHVKPSLAICDQCVAKALNSGGKLHRGFTAKLLSFKQQQYGQLSVQWQSVLTLLCMLCCRGASAAGRRLGQQLSPLYA